MSTRTSIIIRTTPSNSQSSSPSPGGFSVPLSPTGTTTTKLGVEAGSPEGSCLVRVEERRSYFLQVPVSQLADISEGGVPAGPDSATSSDSNSSGMISPVHRSKSASERHIIIIPAEPHSRSRSAQDLHVPCPGSPTPTAKNARHQSLKPSSALTADRRHFSIGAAPSTNNFPAGWLDNLLSGNGGNGSPSSRSGPRQQIFFYHKHDPHYGFTNFSAHPVYYKGKRYPTSEHLFQSFKFQEHRPYLAEHIRTCSERPSVALSEARRFQPEVRKDWKKVNVQKMDEALYHKFTQHPDLKQELLDTGDAELIEDSDKDSFWGIGADRRGRNELGKALERLRAEFRDEY